MTDFTKTLPPRGNEFLPLGTPLHVTQLGLLILKNIYNQAYQNNYPLGYTDDYNLASIWVDTSFNKESGIWGVKPLIVVQRGGINNQPMVVGDRGLENSITKSSLNTSLVYSSLRATVLSKSDEEVDLVGHQIFSAFLTGRSVLRNLTTITNIQNISLSEIGKSVQDDNVWQCTVEMSYLMQYKWTKILTRNVIDELAVYVNNELYFEKIFN